MAVSEILDDIEREISQGDKWKALELILATAEQIDGITNHSPQLSPFKRLNETSSVLSAGDEAAGDEDNTDESVAAVSGGNIPRVMNVDGTYATQSAFSTGGPDSAKKAAKERERPPLRKYLIDGDFFIGAALAGTLTKLALRWDSLVKDEAKQNRFTAECMLIIASVLRLGTSGLPEKAITKDDEDRLQLCLKVLSDKNSLLCSVFSSECRDALGQMLEATVSSEAMSAGAEKKVAAIQPDCPIAFSQLSKLDSLVGAGDVLDISLKQALGTGKISKADFASSKLSKVSLLVCMIEICLMNTVLFRSHS